jgi:hypothetical protein
MDFKDRRKKIDQIWNKILRLNEIFEEENNVSEEELNLVSKYLRQIEQIYAENEATVPPITKPSLLQEQIIEKISIEESLPLPAIASTPDISTPMIEEAPPVVKISSQEYVIHDNTPFPPLVEIAEQEIAAISEEKSINERFVKEEKKDIHAKIVQKTSEKISLADKFLYMGELFGNNPVEYASALSNIDRSHSYSQATDKLNAEYSEKYEWNKKGETLERFFDVIASKFGQ